ncbi:MAG: cobalamin biosynthesis protein CbiG [Gammaproteobacteria bacterium]|nr:MAG: cobalamin biosynthesis protein CbiG [Gammaproteobacteria bacterium]
MKQKAAPVDIFSLGEEGRQLAIRLLDLIPHASHQHRPKPFIEAAQSAFAEGHRCIFICSTGIVMRALAPILKNKYTDPAVIVIDHQGKFVIPLLSGHEGGAGVFAHDIARAISAQCVVTSATDYGRPVYTLGMGCDRGCPLIVLSELVDLVREELDESVSFSALASIDIKADEPGLLELANKLRLPLQFFTASQLREEEHALSEKSEIVFREVGCYGVAEAAALCAATDITGAPAELVILKKKNARATISVARSYAP